MPIRIPDHWKNTLRAIQLKGSPEAAIVGGALRDLTHGVPVKDVDIFVTYRAEVEDTMDEHFGAFGWSVTVAPQSSSYIGSMTDVRAVFEAEDGGHTYNIICLDKEMTMSEMIARIDFGICRIGYNGSYAETPAEFIRDVQNRTFTLLRSDDQKQYDRSMERFERLQAKYKDHTLVIPPQFAKFMPAIREAA